MIKIGPSIISSDFSKLKENIKKAEKAKVDFLHVDIMDGIFVKNITFGPMVVEAISKMTYLPFHVHLMIIEPIRYIKEFSRIKNVELISFHYEATDKILETLKEIKKENKRAGLAINPESSFENIKKFLNKIDEILIMSVHPGFSGQKFLTYVLDKIEEIKNYKIQKKLNFEIAVDGGLNEETIPLVIEKGAEILCIGSYFFKNKNSIKFLKKIKNA
uniref:Ribulose-phosphate 3-epimerase n=1 Tax=candidate division WOR-3 bacterium TaxID=2052148 RepID=A0A7V4E366_UNCW3